jgi:hypothetical protein
VSAPIPPQALATLRREIDLSRARVQAAAERRREHEAALAAARASEEAARQALAALEAVGRDAFDENVGDLRGAEGLQRLAGTQLREMIARVGLRQGELGRPVHWSDWHGWLRAAGFDAAGRKPEATFLTQLARSPLVRRSNQDGVYVLDVGQLAVERERLHRLHGRLAALPAPDQLALIGDLRAQRRGLQNETARAERAVEEMWRVLAQERPPGWPDDEELVPERAVVRWLELHKAAVGA